MERSNGPAATTPAKRFLRVPRTAREITAAAVMIAASVALAYFCKFLTVTPTLRVTFENLPLILSGFLFGPIAGFFTGVAADLISTVISFYGFAGMNPVITLGAGCVGLAAGIAGAALTAAPLKARLAVAVGAGHIVGNMIIKTLALRLYYGTPFWSLAPRIPLYIAIAVFEYAIAYALLRSGGIRKALKLGEDGR